MKTIKLSRRHFLAGGLVALPLASVADALFVEPEWLRVRTIRLSQDEPAHRFAHITDIHFKGDTDYLRKVVNRINTLSPDFVCFTGDLVENKAHIAEALEILEEIESPLYGVPGNHDYWSGADFDQIARSFRKTGGDWLLDRNASIRDGKIRLFGATCEQGINFVPDPEAKNIALIHYPKWIEKLGDGKFDLTLAGHSHGGQIRIPFFGPLLLPDQVGEYDLGLFETPAGPLYVGAGIGEFFLNVRFFCRPEIILFEL
jgi:predicted MPP superfamily phosphohydrolase